ncbi:MAG: FAD-dependent oxidoreductase [Deltaproteobacteria bacterium]|nr:FAD-dependent oxidoreductase [Deltaproteobacteria bacterium]
MTNAAEIVVVGGGLGGLITACHLATGGARVRLLEGGVVGGRAAAGSLRDAGGGPLPSPLNLGPRALYRGGPLDRALKAFGIKPAGFTPPAAGFAWRQGSLHALPTSPSTLLSSSLLRGPGLREAGLALARLTIGAFDVDDGETIGAWIERHAQADDARDLLRALVRVSTYSADDGLDAVIAVRQVRAAIARGVRYVDGGWCGIVAALVEKARSLGVVVEEHCRVESAAGGVVLCADGRSFPAAALVIAGSPQLASTILQTSSSSSPSSLSGPVTSACLDLVLERLPEPGRRFVLGVDVPLYFSVHTARGTAGPVIVHAMAYGAATREELEAFVDVVQPGFRSLIRGSRYLPRMIVAHASPRPKQERQAVVVDAGTVLVGDWLDTPHLIADAVADTAATAARALLQHRVKAAA